MALVLGTDPVSILTQLAYVGDDGDPRRAVADMSYMGAVLVDLTTLAIVLGLEYSAPAAWRLDGDAAIKMELALTECRHRSEPDSLFGHTSIAAARTLLHSGGTCDGCDADIELSGPDARDEVFVHTVGPYRRPSDVSDCSAYRRLAACTTDSLHTAVAISSH